MNDQHFIDDSEWPCHDALRLHNYMLAPVRDTYYAIIKEVCTNDNVDGAELDFQRYLRFFRNDEIEEGKQAMTEGLKGIAAVEYLRTTPRRDTGSRRVVSLA